MPYDFVAPSPFTSDGATIIFVALLPLPSADFFAHHLTGSGSRFSRTHVEVCFERRKTQKDTTWNFKYSVITWTTHTSTSRDSKGTFMWLFVLLKSVYWRGSYGSAVKLRSTRFEPRRHTHTSLAPTD